MAFVSPKKICKQTYDVDFNVFLATSNNCNNNKSRKCSRVHWETSVNVKIMHMCWSSFLKKKIVAIIVLK